MTRPEGLERHQQRLVIWEAEMSTNEGHTFWLLLSSSGAGLAVGGVQGWGNFIRSGSEGNSKIVQTIQTDSQGYNYRNYHKTKICNRVNYTTQKQIIQYHTT